jgi:hypothetical protein
MVIIKKIIMVIVHNIELIIKWQISFDN